MQSHPNLDFVVLAGDRRVGRWPPGRCWEDWGRPCLGHSCRRRGHRPPALGHRRRTRQGRSTRSSRPTGSEGRRASPPRPRIRSPTETSSRLSSRTASTSEIDAPTSFKISSTASGRFRISTTMRSRSSKGCPSTICRCLSILCFRRTSTPLPICEHSPSRRSRWRRHRKNCLMH